MNDFGDSDLKRILRQWWTDISVFLLTAITFVGLALPVIIPTLIMWYLFSIGFQVKP